MSLAAARPPATVRELIDAQAAARPDAIYALATESGASITYAQLARGCRTTAAQLRARGVGAGDTISLVMPNGLGTVRWLLGALRGGVCVNPVNLLSQPEQMRYVLDHSDCRLVVVAPDWEKRVRGLLEGIARKVEVV
ncbi:MAG: class I adenylate-forming enzyme family protein, partial [Caldimonas sp.]